MLCSLSVCSSLLFLRNRIDFPPQVWRQSSCLFPDGKVICKDKKAPGKRIWFRKMLQPMFWYAFVFFWLGPGFFFGGGGTVPLQLPWLTCNVHVPSHLRVWLLLRRKMLHMMYFLTLWQSWIKTWCGTKDSSSLSSMASTQLFYIHLLISVNHWFVHKTALTFFKLFYLIAWFAECVLRNLLFFQWIHSTKLTTFCGKNAHIWVMLSHLFTGKPLTTLQRCFKSLNWCFHLQSLFNVQSILCTSCVSVWSAVLNVLLLKMGYFNCCCLQSPSLY